MHMVQLVTPPLLYIARYLVHHSEIWIYCHYCTFAPESACEKWVYLHSHEYEEYSTWRDENGFDLAKVVAVHVGHSGVMSISRCNSAQSPYSMAMHQISVLQGLRVQRMRVSYLLSDVGVGGHLSCQLIFRHGPGSFH